MFCNTQDIEVKVQYILHEDRQHGTFQTTQGPLFTSAEKSGSGFMLFGLSNLPFFFHINSLILHYLLICVVFDVH